MPAAILKLLTSAASEIPDAELIARFISSRDETAFAELVRRHGPIVHRVCRRLVGTELADDAFQATFLVLACRAERLRKPASVGSWLIGVAGRVARQMRRRESRRAEAIRRTTLHETVNEGSGELSELATILDDELTRLPDPLRDAEFQRERIAKQWFGAPLPNWDKPAYIRVTHAATSSSGSTTLSMTRQAIASMEMNLNGPLPTVLDSLVPHEVAHTVFATHFAKPLPRWADEGLALLHDAPEEQHNHDVRVRELLNGGRAIRLKTLFPMMEYPKDMIVTYAQGHSVCRFLLTQEGITKSPLPSDIPYITRLFQHPRSQQSLLTFLQRGMEKNTPEAWDMAAREVYGFKSVDDLEHAWILWLSTPGSRISSEQAPSKPKEKELDLIPPTELPLVTPRQVRP